MRSCIHKKYCSNCFLGGYMVGSLLFGIFPTSKCIFSFFLIISRFLSMHLKVWTTTYYGRLVCTNVSRWYHLCLSTSRSDWSWNKLSTLCNRTIFSCLCNTWNCYNRFRHGYVSIFENKNRLNIWISFFFRLGSEIGKSKSILIIFILYCW